MLYITGSSLVGRRAGEIIALGKEAFHLGKEYVIGYLHSAKTVSADNRAASALGRHSK